MASRGINKLFNWVKASFNIGKIKFESAEGKILL